MATSAIAPGAITELQLRIAYIGLAAENALMGVGRLRLFLRLDLHIDGLGAAAPVPQTGKGEMHPTPRWNAPHFKANAPHPRSFYQTCALFPYKIASKEAVFFCQASNRLQWVRS